MAPQRAGRVRCRTCRRGRVGAGFEQQRRWARGRSPPRSPRRRAPVPVIHRRLRPSSLQVAAHAGGRSAAVRQRRSTVAFALSSSRAPRGGHSGMRHTRRAAVDRTVAFASSINRMHLWLPNLPNYAPWHRRLRLPGAGLRPRAASSRTPVRPNSDAQPSPPPGPQSPSPAISIRTATSWRLEAPPPRRRPAIFFLAVDDDRSSPALQLLERFSFAEAASVLAVRPRASAAAAAAAAPPASSASARGRAAGAPAPAAAARRHRVEQRDARRSPCAARSPRRLALLSPARGGGGGVEKQLHDACGRRRDYERRQALLSGQITP